MCSKAQENWSSTEEVDDVVLLICCQVARESTSVGYLWTDQESGSSERSKGVHSKLHQRNKTGSTSS